MVTDNRIIESGKEIAINLRDRWLLSDRFLPLHGRWCVRSEQVQSADPPFFVIGHPRSGTTLLRSLLCRHPEIFIPPENGGLWRMIRVFASNRRASWEDVTTAVIQEFMAGYEFDVWDFDVEKFRSDAVSIPQSERALDRLIALLYQRYGSVHAPGKKLWGDKTTPGSFKFLPKLALVFPQARYLHIVRDGRDCVASAMRAGFFNRDVEIAAAAWRDNVHFCRKFGSRLNSKAQYFELRYEELVNDPGAHIPDICAFLKVKSHAAMLENSSEAANELPDVGKLSHHANVSRPVFRDSIGRWKRVFSAQDLTTINRIMAPELHRFGYDV